MDSQPRPSSRLGRRAFVAGESVVADLRYALRTLAGCRGELCKLDAEGERDEPLLAAVMQVTLQASAFTS